MTSHQLFPEIITDILCRLPVKSLVRFRCVSKSWCYQINDPYFIKLHLNHSLKTNTNLSLILRDNHYDLFSSVDLDTLNTGIELNNLIEDVPGTHVIGSCNGLVALFNSHGCDFILWNPSTREYHIIPPTLELPGESTLAYGFGYDPVSDDYKFIRIVSSCYFKEHDLKESKVTVYSLKSNSWRRTRDVPSCFLHYRLLLGTAIHANNTLHWMASKERERAEWRSANVILAFDLRVEEYFEVPQPDYVDNKFNMNIDSLGGCLCVVCKYVGVRVDIWVMKEYGVKESWTKLISVAMLEVRWPYGYVTPLAYSKSGDKILLDQNYDFFWYDLKRKRAEEVRIHGISESFGMGICVRSLVPLNGGQQARREIRKTGNPKKR